MAVAFRSSSSITYAGRTDTVLSAPAGIQNGDILLIYFAVGSTTGVVPTTPTGFTLLSGFPNLATSGGFTVRSYVWYKVASSESGSYTISHATASSEAYMAAISGGDTASAPTGTTNSGTGSTTTALSVTATNAGAFIQFVSQDWGDAGNTLAVPTGTTPTFTARFRGSLVFVCDGILSSSGSTGNKTTGNNSASIDPFTGYLIKVEPPGSAVTPTNLMLLGCGC